MVQGVSLRVKQVLRVLAAFDNNQACVASEN